MKELIQMLEQSKCNGIESCIIHPNNGFYEFKKSFIDSVINEIKIKNIVGDLTNLEKFAIAIMMESFSVPKGGV